MYIKPHQVVSPVTHLSNLSVLYDGGEWDPSKPKTSGWSVAKGIWDGGECFLFRWNSSYRGGGGRPSGVDLGWPVSGGLPVWTVIPALLGEAMLQPLHALKIRRLNEAVVIEG
jgi:hypothetical protein